MYGTKRCLPAYTIILNGDENPSKQNNENLESNLRTLKSADSQMNSRPFSNSNDINQKRILGEKKNLQPISPAVSTGQKEKIKGKEV